MRLNGRFFGVPVKHSPKQVSSEEAHEQKGSTNECNRVAIVICRREEAIEFKKEGWFASHTV